MQLKSIAAPVDFWDFSTAAYEYVLPPARYYGGMLLALHVVELCKFPCADCAAGRDGRHGLRRILFCTAFSNNSEAARSYAISLAAENGGELTLFDAAEKVADSMAKALNVERYKNSINWFQKRNGRCLLRGRQTQTALR